MGVLVTAKMSGFIQDPTRLCRAARRDAEVVGLGAEQQRFALCKDAQDFRTYYQEVEAAEQHSPPGLADGPARAHGRLQRELGKGTGQFDRAEKLGISGTAPEQEALFAHGREMWRLHAEECRAASSRESKV